MLEKKIQDDYLQAMKSRDKLRSSVLSFLRAELLNVQVAKNKTELDDAEVIAVIKKQAKQRQDSIEQFTRGGRTEMAGKEQQELGILKSYLPAELPAEDLRKIVEEAVSETGARGQKDMGKVMKEVMARVAGKADGKLVSELVKQRLMS